MTLKAFIDQEGLMDFAVRYPSLMESWNRIKIYDARAYGNGYQFASGKSHFRVTVKFLYGTVCYWAERANARSGNMFFKIPCNTRAEEEAYPLCASWIGTLLADKAKAENWQI